MLSINVDGAERKLAKQLNQREIIDDWRASIFDVIVGDFVQLTVLICHNVIAQWRAKKSALPVVAIGPNESEYLEDSFAGLVALGKLQLVRIKSEDGRVGLDTVLGTNMTNVAILILSPESGGLGIMNDIPPIYDWCQKNGVILFSDVSGPIIRQEKFLCHVGIGNGISDAAVFWMHKHVMEAIGYYHAPCTTNWLAIVDLGRHFKDVVDVRAANRDMNDTIRVINKGNGILIKKYTTYIKEPVRDCLVATSNIVEGSTTFAFAIVRDGKVITRAEIISYVKQRMAGGQANFVIGLSQAKKDTVKANTITYCFVRNAGAREDEHEGLISLIRHWMASR
jgi:hypothetical protein